MTLRDALSEACGQSWVWQHMMGSGQQQRSETMEFLFCLSSSRSHPIELKSYISSALERELKLDILNPVVFENIYVTFITEPSAVSRADSRRLSSSGLLPRPPPPPSRASRPPIPSSATSTSRAGHTLTPTEPSLLRILILFLPIPLLLVLWRVTFTDLKPTRVKCQQ